MLRDSAGSPAERPRSPPPGRREHPEERTSVAREADPALPRTGHARQPEAPSQKPSRQLGGGRSSGGGLPAGREQGGPVRAGCSSREPGKRTGERDRDAEPARRPAPVSFRGGGLGAWKRIPAAATTRVQVSRGAGAEGRPPRSERLDLTRVSRPGPDLGGRRAGSSGRGGVSAYRAVSRVPWRAVPRGRSWGWERGSSLAAAIPAPRGRAAGGAPPPTWAGRKAEASVGTFPRCCVRAGRLPGVTLGRADGSEA